MTSSDGIERKECPYRGCDWSTDYDPATNTSEIAAEVDAEIHWETEHGGEVAEDADFGDAQCPECWAMNGMNGSTTCGECGYIPEEVRA